MSAFADLALAYHAAGANVVPITTGTKIPPSGLRWAPWRHRRQTPEDLARLVAAHRDADIAVVLHDGLVDLETDSPAGEQALRDLGLPLPPTASWSSPRGVHRLYRSAHPVRSRIGLHPDLDLLADGRLVVVPSSTGRRWLTTGGLAEVAEFPDAWIEMLTRGGDSSSNPSISANPSTKQVGTTHIHTTPIVPTCLVDGRSLLSVECAPEFLPAVARALGLPHQDIGSPFRCILPGHDEKEPSASIKRMPDGTLHYHDWHNRSGKEWFTLAEVYAARVTGKVRPLCGPELATWKLRLVVDAGLMQPVLVDLPPLPSSADPVLLQVSEGFRLLLGCKWLYEQGDPTTFTVRFASRWCGVSEWRAGIAVRELIRLGVIRQVGTYKAYGKRMALFLPGSGVS